MGSLYKRLRSKYWWIAYTVNGRQHCESTHTTNARLAQKLLAVREAAVLEGRFNLPKSNPPRFRGWAKECIAAVQHPNTRRRYTSSMNNLLPYFGDTRLPDINAGRIKEFVVARLASRVSNASVNRDLAFLRRILRLAQRRRWVVSNPFAEVELLNETKSRRQPHVLTPDEEGRLMAAIPANSYLRPLVALLVETGLRVNKEALRLKWADIDFYYDSVGAVHVQESKTAAGRRSVPLSPYCRAELLRWRNLFGPELSVYVFPNLRDTSTFLEDARCAWKNAIAAAGLPAVWLYDLRATFASRLNAAGVPELQIAYMLGHSSSRIVSTYAKAVWDAHRDAICRLGEFRKSERRPARPQISELLQ
jgi:integrase